MKFLGKVSATFGKTVEFPKCKPLIQPFEILETSREKFNRTKISKRNFQKLGYTLVFFFGISP